MEALREIIRSQTARYTMTLPEWAVGRDVEVIVLPLVMPEKRLRQNTSDLMPKTRKCPAPELQKTRIIGNIMEPVVPDSAWEVLHEVGA